LPFPNFHSARLKDPALFREGFTTLSRGMPKGVTILVGELKTGGAKERQAVRFAKDVWTVAGAKAWLADQGLKPIQFEEADDNQDADDLVVVPYKATPALPDDRSWDADQATSRARKKAAGGGELDLTDAGHRAAYRPFFGLVDGDPTNLDSYKYIHHDVDDANRMVVNLAGVRAALSASGGGRSGDPVPNPQRDRLQSHLRKHLDANREDTAGDGDNAGDWVYRIDRGTMLQPRMTDEGFMLFVGDIAKPGILEYRDANGGITRELVPPEELHKDASVATIGRKPITLEHPPGGVFVDPDNVKDLQVGDVDGDIELVTEGGYVRIKGCIRRRDAVNEVRAKRIVELSPGYRCRLDRTPGHHPEFGDYDAIQRDRRYNHLALTEAARGGKDIRLRADSAISTTRVGSGPQPFSLFGGFAMNFKQMLAALRDAAARLDSADARSGLMRLVDDMTSAYKKAEDDLAKAQADLKAKEDELTGTKEELEQLKQAKADSESDDAQAQAKADRLDWFKDRTELVKVATDSGLKADDLDKLDNDQIREQVVRKKLDSKDVPENADAGFFKAAFAVMKSQAPDQGAPRQDGRPAGGDRYDGISQGFQSSLQAAPQDQQQRQDSDKDNDPDLLWRNRIDAQHKARMN